MVMVNPVPRHALQVLWKVNINMHSLSNMNLLSCATNLFNAMHFNFSLNMIQIIPTKMKRMLEDGDLTDSSMFEDVSVDPVVRGFIKDWDAMEDLLHYVLYTGLGWEIGNEGQILFTDPLSTPKVDKLHLLPCPFSDSIFAIKNNFWIHNHASLCSILYIINFEFSGH